MQGKMISVKKKKKVLIKPYVFLLIPIFLVIVFSFYPFIKTIISSFSTTTQYGQFIQWRGLGNWQRMFSNREFVDTIVRTVKFAGMVLVMSMTVSMFLAILCANEGKGSRVYQTLFGLPMVIASVAISIVWQFILRQHGGILNQVLGTNNSWLNDTRYAMILVACITAWSHVAMNFIYLLVGFRNVSDDLIEAAKIDGASWWTRTFKIMIPIASPQIFFVLFLNIVSSLKTFTQIKLLTAGGPGSTTKTLIYYIYEHAIMKGQFEYGCCEAIVLFLLIFIATRIQFATEKKFVHYS